MCKATQYGVAILSAVSLVEVLRIKRELPFLKTSDKRLVFTDGSVGRFDKSEMVFEVLESAKF